MALFKGNIDEYKEPARFEWKAGDRVICISEDTEVLMGKPKKDKPSYPYAKTVLRVVAGPTNDPKRYAGPTRGEKDGKSTIFSRFIWDMLSFSPHPYCQNKIMAYLLALGHTGHVDCDDSQSWQDNTLDHEVVVVVEMEEYEGKENPKVRRHEKLTVEDRRLVAGVYEEFGCARGAGWTGEPVESLHEWDYGKEEEDTGSSALSMGGGRRGRTSARPPARDEGKVEEKEVDMQSVKAVAAEYLTGTVVTVSERVNEGIDVDVMREMLWQEAAMKRPRKGVLTVLEDAIKVCEAKGEPADDGIKEGVVEDDGIKDDDIPY